MAAFLAAVVAAVGCGGGEGEGEGEDGDTSTTVTYSQVDLEGTWRGTAENADASFDLDLQVNAGGTVSGAGVGAQWQIDDAGAVTGSGVFAFMSGGYLVSTTADWDLDMSEDKKSLNGIMDVMMSPLHDMSVTLTRPGGGGGTDVSVAGSWLGSWASSGISGDLSFALDQDGVNVSGSAAFTGSPCMANGVVAATVAGTSLSGSLDDGTSTGSFGAEVTGDSMAGEVNLGTGPCAGAIATFSAVRQ